MEMLITHIARQPLEKAPSEIACVYIHVRVLYNFIYMSLFLSLWLLTFGTHLNNLRVG